MPIIHLASNWLNHDPIQSARRRVGRNIVNVPQPHVIRRYNDGMGGVDLLDRLLSSYRPTIKAKKWWWPLFLNVVNMSVVAAWRLYSRLHPQLKVSHLDFRRTITLCLLKRKIPRVQIGGGHHADLPDDIRYDGVGHISEATTQGRCVVCSKNTRSKCLKCNVRLHYSHLSTCFLNYHTKNQ